MAEPNRTLIGREEALASFTELRQKLWYDGVGYLWVGGESGCGKSAFLQTCAYDAQEAGWEVLRGECTDETRSNPYGPFLSMLGLCFDKSGKLINDRSVYSIVDQISLDDVVSAVEDIPGVKAVAFGIKLGMTIFESRRGRQKSDDLQNRNFEFIMQVLQQIGRKRKTPILLVIDDLHMAGATTYALLEYILTRIQETRLLVMATWCAESAGAGHDRVLKSMRRFSQPEYMLHLSPLSAEQMHQLLNSMCQRPLPRPLADTLIELSRGLPKVLSSSLPLLDLESNADIAEGDWKPGMSQSALQLLLDRQLAQASESQRALLECASLLRQPVPLSLLTSAALCDYLGMSERALLSMIVEMADHGTVLVWEGEGAVRFASTFLRRFLRDSAKPPVTRRDHLCIAQAWQAVEGDVRPAQLARHYLAGGDLHKALSFALQSAQELVRSAAYPEAVQSYKLTLKVLAQMPDRGELVDVQYNVLRAMAAAAEQAGNWDESLARLQDALAASEENLARQADIYASLGWLHFLRGQVQQALEFLDRSAELFTRLGDVRGQAQVVYYLGMLYSAQKEWRRAIDCFEQFLETSEQEGFSEGRASAYIELGNLYRLQRKWEQSEDLLQQGIDLAQVESDYVTLVQGYHYLGLCYAWQGNAESVEMLHRALEIVHTRTKQPVQESHIQNTLAETLVRQNRWREAEAAFRASAQIKERLGDKAGLAMTYGGLGRLYSRQWRFEQAAEYLQKDLDILCEEFEANIAWIQQLTNMIGEVRRLQGKFEQAQKHFDDAFSLAARIPDEVVRKQSLGYVHMFMAELALDQANMDQAEANCALALDLLSGTWAEGNAQRTAARLARMRGQMEQARRHLDSTLAAAQRAEDVDLAQAFLEEAHFYQDMGDPAKVNEKVVRVVELAERLQNRELARRARALLAADGDKRADPDAFIASR